MDDAQQTSEPGVSGHTPVIATVYFIIPCMRVGRRRTGRGRFGRPTSYSSAGCWWSGSETRHKFRSGGAREEGSAEYGGGQHGGDPVLGKAEDVIPTVTVVVTVGGAEGGVVRGYHSGGAVGGYVVEERTPPRSSQQRPRFVVCGGTLAIIGFGVVDGVIQG